MLRVALLRCCAVMGSIVVLILYNLQDRFSLCQNPVLGLILKTKGELSCERLSMPSMNGQNAVWPMLHIMSRRPMRCFNLTANSSARMRIARLAKNRLAEKIDEVVIDGHKQAIYRKTDSIMIS